MVEERLFKKYLLLLPKEISESDVLDDECKLLCGVLASWADSTNDNKPKVAHKQLMELTNTDTAELSLNIAVLKKLGFIDVGSHYSGVREFRLNWLFKKTIPLRPDEEEVIEHIKRITNLKKIDPLNGIDVEFAREHLQCKGEIDLLKTFEKIVDRVNDDDDLPF